MPVGTFDNESLCTEPEQIVACSELTIQSIVMYISPIYVLA